MAGKKKTPRPRWPLARWPSIFPSPVSVLLFGKDSDGRVSRHPSVSGALVWGSQDPLRCCPAGPQATLQGHQHVPCHPAGCSSQIPPVPPGAAGADAGRKAHAHEAFPSSLGKLVGLVWLCVSEHSQTRSVLQVGLGFSLFSFCAALSVLRNRSYLVRWWDNLNRRRKTPHKSKTRLEQRGND